MQQSLSTNSDAYERFGKLLVWMLAIFNQKVTEKELESMVKVWAGGLNDLSTEELRNGCRWVKNSGSQFMPSIPTFRFRCKGLVSEQEAFSLIATDELHTNPAAHAAFETVKKYCSWNALTLKQQKTVFFTRYNRICEKIMEGKLHLPPISDNNKEKKQDVANDNLSQGEYKDIGEKYIKIIKEKFNFNTNNNYEEVNYATS